MKNAIVTGLVCAATTLTALVVYDRCESEYYRRNFNKIAQKGHKS